MDKYAALNKQTPIAIFGLGISGLATARWLVDHGYDVIAWDDNEASRQRAAAAFADHNSREHQSSLSLTEGPIDPVLKSQGDKEEAKGEGAFKLEPFTEEAPLLNLPSTQDQPSNRSSNCSPNHSSNDSSNHPPKPHQSAPTQFILCKILVLSPGIPLYHPEPHPVVIAARALGMEIIGDIELFHRLHPDLKTIGITGTNGKSTTTALQAHALQACGRKAFVGGNIGAPVFDLPIDPHALYVFELSSFQLDLCPTFRPDISVLLNISPDHLDRHGDMETYAGVKERIMEGEGQAVITGTDEYSQDILHNEKLRGGRAILEVCGGEMVKETKALCGAHNIQNMQAAYTVCQALELDKVEILKAFETFPGLPHRQYFVREWNGVIFINDSKATSAEAAGKALASFDNIYWILGGRPKEGRLQGLEEFAPKICAAFVIGEAAADQDFVGWLSDHDVTHLVSKTLEQAVQDALAQIEKDRAAEKVEACTVLLSPACASYDQFKSFEERGQRFVEIVEGIS